jgi:hypothetical protein
MSRSRRDDDEFEDEDFEDAEPPPRRSRRRRERDREPDDDDDEPLRGSSRRVPQGRTYICHRCEGATYVSDDSFSHISNPFRLCTSTYCCGCEDFVRLSEVEWEDTGELVSDFRSRIRQQAPLFLKFWFFGLGLILGAILGAMVGWLVANGQPPRKVQDAIWMGVVFGAIGVYFFGGLILHACYGIDYRRYR